MTSPDSHRTNPVATTTLELRQHLLTLDAERRAATVTGLERNELYLRDLEDEIEAAHHAYVGAAVTEITSFRRQLIGPQVG